VELGRPKKKSKGRAYYAEALELFEELQAVPYAERTRAAMNQIG
jgi:hypothetical protein